MQLAQRNACSPGTAAGPGLHPPRTGAVMEAGRGAGLSQHRPAALMSQPRLHITCCRPATAVRGLHTPCEGAPATTPSSWQPAAEQHRAGTPGRALLRSAQAEGERMLLPHGGQGSVTTLQSELELKTYLYCLLLSN